VFDLSRFGRAASGLFAYRLISTGVGKSKVSFPSVTLIGSPMAMSLRFLASSIAAFAVFGRESTSKLGVLPGEANLLWGITGGGDRPGRVVSWLETDSFALVA